MSAIEHIRANIRHLPDFAPAFAPAHVVAQQQGMPLSSIVKLDANENLYGPSPKVRQALASFSDWNIYPDSAYQRLNEALAAYAGVEPDQIVATNGGDELIGLVAEFVIEPGCQAINCVPTFSVYTDAVLVQGGEMVAVPRRKDDDYALDTSAVLEAVTDRTRLVFLCNPNNPSGGLTPQSDIETVLRTGVMVLVDETYFEFSGATSVGLLARYPNLIILRSLSKWAGLAGLRVGYGIFHPDVARHFRKIRMLFNVNQAGYLAALASLEDTAYLHGNVAKLVRERQHLFDLLSHVPFLHVYPSHGNFILCDVLGANAQQLHDEMEKEGVLVRVFQNKHLPNAVRISVGKPEHTARLMDALHQAGGRLNLL